MSFVLDASVTMDWCLIDEANSYSQSALDYLRRSHAVVPELWLLEISNVLLMKENRKKITRHGADEFLAMLRQLDIRVQYEDSDLRSRSILAMARKYRLTVYDAAYLELAARQEVPLATRDKDLLWAAPLAGVPIFSPSPNHPAPPSRP